jgi:hypothetical protein
MHSTNWDGFVDLSCTSADGKTSPSKMVKRIYLQLAGAAMSMIEGLQNVFPKAGLIRKIGSLSPATPSARK